MLLCTWLSCFAGKKQKQYPYWLRRSSERRRRADGGLRLYGHRERTQNLWTDTSTAHQAPKTASHSGASWDTTHLTTAGTVSLCSTNTWLWKQDLLSKAVLKWKIYWPILFVKLLPNFSFLTERVLSSFFVSLSSSSSLSHWCFCDSVPCDEDKSNIASLLREVFVSSSCLILALNTNWKCNNPYNVKQSNTGCLLPQLSLFRSPPPKKIYICRGYLTQS